MTRTCGWKMGELAPVCGAPSVTTIQIKFPDWVMGMAEIDPAQQQVTIGLCEQHEALAQLVDPRGEWFGFPAERRQVKARASTQRDDLPIDPAHREHTEYQGDCLGCALDFGVPI